MGCKKIYKTLMTARRRNIFAHKMVVKIGQRHDNNVLIRSLVGSLVDDINCVIRSKYSEKDVEALSKYGFSRRVTSFKFVLPETGEMFGFSLSKLEAELFSESLFEIPCDNAGESDAIFEVDVEFKAKVDSVKSVISNTREKLLHKINVATIFLNSCRYVEDYEIIMADPQRATDIAIKTLLLEDFFNQGE